MKQHLSDFILQLFTLTKILQTQLMLFNIFIIFVLIEIFKRIFLD